MINGKIFGKNKKSSVQNFPNKALASLKASCKNGRMEKLFVIDRQQTKVLEEKTVMKKGVYFLFEKNSQNPFKQFLKFILTRFSLVSKLIGFLSRRALSKKNIQSFTKTYLLKENEWEKKPEEFTSFHDFFIRKLKPSARPIDTNPRHLIAPCDGRYQFFENFKDTLEIKQQKFSIEELLGLEKEALKDFEDPTICIIRLAPVDYHRFHFPIDSKILIPPKEVKGLYNSVHPVFSKDNFQVYMQNKRMVTKCLAVDFSLPYFMVEVGALCVGSIVQTFSKKNVYQKGEEKGYFAFGGSSVLLIFPKNRVTLFPDLQAINLKYPQKEILCLMGEGMYQIPS